MGRSSGPLASRLSGLVCSWLYLAFLRNGALGRFLVIFQPSAHLCCLCTRLFGAAAAAAPRDLPAERPLAQPAEKQPFSLDEGS